MFTGLAYLSAVVMTILLIRSRLQLDRVRREDADERARLAAALESGAQCAAQLELVEALSDQAIVHLSSSGLIRAANPTATRLLAASRVALPGRTILEATLSPAINGVLQDAVRQQKQVEREVKAVTSDGTLWVSAAPLSGWSDEGAEILLVARDISDVRRLENARRDFVANVSHEMRTPLASIRAMAETLDEGALHDEKVASRFLQTIIQEADRLTRISERLLILSHAESNDPERQAFDIGPLCSAIVARFDAQAQRSGVRISAEVPEPLVVWANRDMMEQVLVNLIDNALKYTPGPGSVTVTACPEGDCAAIRIADTGIGIMQQDLPRLFERFYRVDKARARASGGTGLGLSIVKHIVEAHGGAVSVRSEFNRGSVFIFTVPLASTPPAEARMLAAQA